jgi:hypothetical protein
LDLNELMSIFDRFNAYHNFYGKHFEGISEELFQELKQVHDFSFYPWMLSYKGNSQFYA